MNNNKAKGKIYNSYTALDAFKFFFFLVISIFGASLIFQIILNIVASSTGQTYQALTSTDVVKVLEYVISPVVLIVYFLVYNHIRKIRPKEAFSDGKPVSLLPISIAMVLAIICVFLFTPFMNLVDYLFMRAGYTVDNSLPMEEKMKSSIGFFALGIVIFALLPAIAEEIVFRGVIQKALLSKYTPFVAVFFSTLLFVLMHGSLQQTVYQLVVGVMLGYIACVGGSILYSIILHFLSNLLVLIFGCFDIVPYLNADNTVYYNFYSMVFPICIFLLGLGLVAILFWVLKYLRRKNFFRDEPKKKKFDEPVPVTEPKIGLKAMWGSLGYLEKVFLLASVVTVGILWIINTVSGFIG